MHIHWIETTGDIVFRELLSPQQHYDWGLRALKTVLRGCGSLLQSERSNSNNQKGNLKICSYALCACMHAISARPEGSFSKAFNALDIMTIYVHTWLPLTHIINFWCSSYIHKYNCCLLIFVFSEFQLHLHPCMYIRMYAYILVLSHLKSKELGIYNGGRYFIFYSPSHNVAVKMV